MEHVTALANACNKLFQEIVMPMIRSTVSDIPKELIRTGMINGSVFDSISFKIVKVCVEPNQPKPWRLPNQSLVIFLNTLEQTVHQTVHQTVLEVQLAGRWQKAVQDLRVLGSRCDCLVQGLQHSHTLETKLSFDLQVHFISDIQTPVLRRM